MPTVTHGGKTFTTDKDGFISDFSQWCPEWVAFVQKEEGIDELTDEHWKVMNVLRDFYGSAKSAPMIQILARVSEIKIRRIYELFPSGPAKGACRMAGLPNSNGCVL